MRGGYGARFHVKGLRARCVGPSAFRLSGALVLFSTSCCLSAFCTSP